MPEATCSGDLSGVKRRGGEASRERERERERERVCVRECVSKLSRGCTANTEKTTQGDGASTIAKC